MERGGERVEEAHVIVHGCLHKEHSEYDSLSPFSLNRHKPIHQMRGDKIEENVYVDSYCFTLSTLTLIC